MRPPIQTPLRAIAAAALLAIGLPPAGPRAAGAFPDTRLVETGLERGVSTRREVGDLLGLPDGIGGAAFPPDHRPKTVWYYEDIEIEDMASGGGGLRLTMGQRILLVFFDGDLFDGFAWSSNRIPGAAR